MSWDDDDFEAPPTAVATKTNWDDEDVEVKPSWDEEAPVKPTPTQKVPPKPTTKAAKSAADKKAKEAHKPDAPLDPLEEKLRKQKLVEEADYQNARDIFSGVGDRRADNEEESLDFNSFQPSSEAEFERLASALVKKFSTLESSGLYLGFLKSLVRQICTPLPRVEDCKEIIAVLNVIVNDKLKAEKEKTKPKKKGGATATSGKKANVKDAFDYDGGDYDDGGDDFM